jgi:hypothetical protein
LDTFFNTLDSKALAITTSQPFLFVKAAEASLSPLTTTTPVAAPVTTNDDASSPVAEISNEP